MSPLTKNLLSIAPMIDWTYSHFRVFMKLMAPQALLYTEMQTTGAVLHNPKKALQHHTMEHPLALQLGGSDPKLLAECAKIAEQVGFAEINLNLGCPSDKVKAGHFGACLMNEPVLVAECIGAMREAVSIPVSAKTRIGVDLQDSYEYFSNFVHHLVHAGCQKVIVHARKAWLQGLSPKQNRTIPPVNYDYVYSLKKEFPNLPIHINGNIFDIQNIRDHLKQVDGVMLGRLACDNPYHIAEIHHALYPEHPLKTRSDILQLYLSYLLDEHSKGTTLSVLLKPLFNFAFGLPGAREWKKRLMALLQSKNTDLFKELRQFLVQIETVPKFEIFSEP